MRTPRPREGLRGAQSHVSRLTHGPQGESLHQSRWQGAVWRALTCFSLVDHKFSIGQRNKHLVIQIPGQGKGEGVRGFRRPEEVPWGQGTPRQNGYDAQETDAPGREPKARKG